MSCSKSAIADRLKAVKAAKDADYYRLNSVKIRAKRVKYYRRNRSSVLARQAPYHLTPRGKEIHKQASLRYARSAKGVAAGSRNGALLRARRHGFRRITPANYDVAWLIEQAEYLIALRKAEPLAQHELHHICDVRMGGIHDAGWLLIVTLAEHVALSREEDAYRKQYMARVKATKLADRRDRYAWKRAWERLCMN